MLSPVAFTFFPITGFNFLISYPPSVPSSYSAARTAANMGGFYDFLGTRCGGPNNRDIISGWGKNGVLKMTYTVADCGKHAICQELRSSSLPDTRCYGTEDPKITTLPTKLKHSGENYKTPQKSPSENVREPKRLPEAGILTQRNSSPFLGGKPGVKSSDIPKTRTESKPTTRKIALPSGVTIPERYLKPFSPPVIEVDPLPSMEDLQQEVNSVLRLSPSARNSQHGFPDEQLSPLSSARRLSPSSRYSQVEFPGEQSVRDVSPLSSARRLSPSSRYSQVEFPDEVNAREFLQPSSARRLSSSGRYLQVGFPDEQSVREISQPSSARRLSPSDRYSQVEFPNEQYARGVSQPNTARRLSPSSRHSQVEFHSEYKVNQPAIELAKEKILTIPPSVHTDRGKSEPSSMMKKE